MSVTNNIRDNVIYDNDYGWEENKLTNDEIISLLNKQKDFPFLSFSYRCLDYSICKKQFIKKFNKAR